MLYLKPYLLRIELEIEVEVHRSTPLLHHRSKEFGQDFTYGPLLVKGPRFIG
jgi:hypothetical protein